MTSPTNEDPSKIEQAEAAEKIEEAGVADESAAYTDAINKGEAAADVSDTAAHPS